MRFTLDPQGVVTPDAAAKLPGRGVWVGASAATLAQAMKRNAFARSLKRPAAVPADLAAQAEAALARRVLAQLGLARKAGAVALGQAGVEALVRAGGAGVLVEAADASADGRDKVLRLAAAVGRPVRLLGCFTAAELGMALGRDRVVHGAVMQGGLALRLTEEIDRLAGFRAIVPHFWPFSEGFGGPTGGDAQLASPASDRFSEGDPPHPGPAPRDTDDADERNT